MDDAQELKQEVLDVRKVIEKSTSKVSLRDLEKKGFRQVKVLRAGDINQLIFKAVQNVLAKQPRSGMTEEERQQIVKEARSELDRQLKEKKQIAADKGQIEEAKLRLEAKVNELNQQMAAERRAFEAEKQTFSQQKQSLFEKSLENQKAAAGNYQGQIDDLRQRLERAEAKKDKLESEVERLRRLDVANERLQEDVERLRAERDDLKEKAASGAHTSGVMNADAAELQRMRMEAEQRDAHMKSMIEGLASTLASAGGGGGGGTDLSKQFKSLQLSLSDQLRKGIGSMGRGGQDFDLSPEAAAALFASQADDVKLETNIKDIVVKEQKAAGVNDKLAKLRNLRKK
jgi:chromosome segregation ATPase